MINPYLYSTILKKETTEVVDIINYTGSTKGDSVLKISGNANQTTIGSKFIVACLAIGKFYLEFVLDR
ncbi:MAG: hypothetical protein IKC10_04640 [Alphaproteobacteria bacterium]|nr:hypothetical protein [Alphaproteobacteria bacterium]